MNVQKRYFIANQSLDATSDLAMGNEFDFSADIK